MTAGGSRFVPFREYATNYIALVDPGLQSGQRFSELRKLMESLSYRTADAITVFPIASHYERYKAELIEFIRMSACGSPADLSERLEGIPALFVGIKWRLGNFEPEPGHRREFRSFDSKEVWVFDGSPVAQIRISPESEDSVSIHAIDMSFLLDERITSLIDCNTVIQEWYRDLRTISSPPSADRKLTTAIVADRINSWLVLKPTVFGLGVDLGRIIHDTFLKSPSDRAKR